MVADNTLSQLSLREFHIYVYNRNGKYEKGKILVW